MKFIVEIELGNDAMQTAADLVATLRNIANRVETFEDELVVERGFKKHFVNDRNGNRVGFFESRED